MLLKAVLAFIWLGVLAVSFPTNPAGSLTGKFPLSSKVIAQLNKNETFLENIAIRENGDLLVTMVQPTPSLYLVKRPWSANPELSVVHNFEASDGIIGISETDRDTFVVSATKFDGFVQPTANTSTLQEIMFHQKSQSPTSRIVARIPEAGLLNGIAILPEHKSVVLVADSFLGIIWRVDLTTGHYKIAIDVPETRATKPDALLQIGVNGLKIHKGYLYWSNTNLISIFRVRISEEGNLSENAIIETIAEFKDTPAIDDFVINETGTIWVTTNVDGKLYTVDADGSIRLVLGSSTEMTLAGDTAAAFGRTRGDSHILYVTTAGGIAAPINGTVIEPGKVVAIDTRGYF
jgi:sugar lactone lactonase YvrE